MDICDILCDLISQHGRELSEDAARCEAFLRDYCPHERGKVNVLVGAVRERVGADLLRGSALIPLELQMARLVKRLEDHLAMREDIAQWAVESWAMALGVVKMSNPVTSGPAELASIRKAADHGDALAQFKLGRYYEIGAGVPQDHGEAVMWYRKAANQGQADAQCFLGDLLNDEQSVQQDHAEAVRWYRQAAAQGHAEAQCNLGLQHEFGYGVPQDNAEAMRWFHMAAEKGHAEAQFHAGFHYYSGQCAPMNDAKAVMWFRKAADQGHAEAQNKLGFLFDCGIAAPQDHEQAVNWFRKAADQGHAEAQNQLGGHYDRGEGVAQDHAEAIKWYRKAADQGDAEAQYQLGFHYAKGQGISQNYFEAVKWYRKAADKGHAGAQKELGFQYANGQGLPQDHIEAARWYSRAKVTDSMRVNFAPFRKWPKRVPRLRPSSVQSTKADEWRGGENASSADDSANVLGAVPFEMAADDLIVPGALVSGAVTFSDGKQANWSLDQAGRLSLQKVEPGYRPPEADVPMFQQKLEKILVKMGMS